MKVLFAVSNYPHLSETYTTTEIAFALKSGIQAEVWSTHCKDPSIPTQVPVHRGSLQDAIATFKPDLIHMHYLVFGQTYSDQVPPSIPMTLRGHSFDFSPDRALSVARIDRIKKIYLFPHFARLVRSPKIVPLPVSYNSTIYQLPHEKHRNVVLRLAAGKHGKGLEDVFSTAALCPNHEFMLGIAELFDDPAFFHKLAAKNAGLSHPVRMIKNVPWNTAQLYTTQAGINLNTNDPTIHPFGMPVSIAESLATGTLVLAKRSPSALEYLGDAGYLYDSPQDAASFIRSTLSWTQAQWNEVQTKAVARARLYADTTVLPNLIQDWKEIVG
jgi:glycosyltransferase involved in cell wall biosynthesis